MNILYIGNIAQSMHDYKWISFFDKKNINLYCVDGNNEMPFEDKELEKKYANSNIKVLNSLPHFSFKNIFRTIKTIKYLNQIIREKEINAVHVLFATPFSLWCLFLNVPFIITTRGSDVLMVLKRISQRKGIVDFLFFLMFKRIFKKAAAITSTSNKQVECLKEIFDVKSQVIRTGVDVDYISNVKVEYSILPKEIQGKDLIFSPRWIAPEYDIALQVESLQYLSKEIIDRFLFVFVRYNDENEGYINMIKDQLKLTGHVNYVILNILNVEQMYQIYKKASLVIMTPISDGTPNTALEAMSAKTPVITSDLNYDKELFDGTCFKLNPRTPKKLAALIEKALLDKSNESMVEKAFQRVKIHGNRAFEMKKVENIYLDICG